MSDPELSLDFVHILFYKALCITYSDREVHTKSQTYSLFQGIEIFIR